MHGKMMMMMKEYFSFSGEIKNFIFEDLNIHGPAGLVGVSLICFMFTVTLEGLKSFLFYLGLRMNQKGQIYDTSMKMRYLTSGSLLHALDIFLAYMLMLAVMTYNAYICVAVVVGSGLGHFIFGAINRFNRDKFSEVKLGLRDRYNSQAELTPCGSNEDIEKY